MKRKKYLITGCAGFIGSNLVKALYKKHDLILVDDLSEGKITNLPKAARRKLIKKRIQNIKSFKTNKIDGIFHLAAQASVPLSLKNYYTSSSNNLVSSIKVFEISKKYSAPVVYASSSAVYGNLPLGDDTVNKFLITSPYAQDKLSVEDYAKMSFKIFKISSIGLRFFNVYGPGQSAISPYSSVIPIFINQMLKNLPVTINGGFQTRDFIYIEDVIYVMIKSMNKLKQNKIFKIFNLGTGRSIRIEKLFNIIKKNLGVKIKVIRKKIEKFDSKKSSGTFYKINKFLKLNKNNFTKLETGLSKTINYMKNNH